MHDAPTPLAELGSAFQSDFAGAPAL